VRPTPAPADGRHTPPEGMQRDFRNSACSRVSPTRPPLSHTVSLLLIEGLVHESPSKKSTFPYYLFGFLDSFIACMS